MSPRLGLRAKELTTVELAQDLLKTINYFEKLMSDGFCQQRVSMEPSQQKSQPPGGTPACGRTSSSTLGVWHSIGRPSRAASLPCGYNSSIGFACGVFVRSAIRPTFGGLLRANLSSPLTSWGLYRDDLLLHTRHQCTLPTTGATPLRRRADCSLDSPDRQSGRLR